MSGYTSLHPLIGYFISLLGIVYIIANYKINKDQTFRELFREFNKRFDDINEHLNEIVDGVSDSRRERKTIQDYLNLCSEEYLWWKKNRIEKSVWKAWRAGMLYYLITCPKIKYYFLEEYKKGNDESYYSFLSYIIKYIPNE